MAENEGNYCLTSRILSWFRWCPTSKKKLEDSERKLLSYVKAPLSMTYISVLHDGEKCRIRTLCINRYPEDNKEHIPLVLLHGLGGGVGHWYMNYDDLWKNRNVYAIDVLGFGLSSHPDMIGSPKDVEQKLVESIEQWRKHMQLEKFVLVGHSMGGFLAYSYAINYPDKVCHLILADPWGFTDRNKANFAANQPWWMTFYKLYCALFCPLSMFRAFGPLGPVVANIMCSTEFKNAVKGVDKTKDFSDYLYHCNARAPSGEMAFRIMSMNFIWAKSPMINRAHELRADVPLTFVYGSDSWIDSRAGYEIQEIRRKSRVHVEIISGADHFVNTYKSEIFNSIVSKICDQEDKDSNSG